MWCEELRGIGIFVQGLPAEPDSAHVAREAIKEFVIRVGASENEIFEIVAASGEAIINACEHAYKDLPYNGSFNVKGDLTENRTLTIIVEDFGCWTHKAELEANDLFGERGRGIMMMEILCDATFYSRLPNDPMKPGPCGTVVILKKILQG